MQNDFSDLPSADPEATEGFRKLLEERQNLGDYRFQPRHSGHQNLVEQMLNDQADVLIIVGAHDGAARALEVLKHNPPSTIIASGGPGLGKSYHGSMRDRFIHVQLEVSDAPLDFFDYGDFHYVSEADERKLPEWQKRRNKSAEAKQALINKLKAKRRAR